jgi:polar amino acid transport system permease protein
MRASVSALALSVLKGDPTVTGAALVCTSHQPSPGCIFDTYVYWHFLFSPEILQGVLVTIELSVISQLTGIALGIFAALGRLSTLKLPIFRWIAGLYIWFFRGTPLLVQMAFVYFAIPQITNFNLVLDAFVSAFVALSLNEGAYMAEIVRAGILSVDQGQLEAAQSLGMRRSLAMRRIVLPQAIRVIIPPTGNEFISMLKNTSLAYSITAVELFYQGQIIYSSGIGLGSQRYFELLAVVSTWYLAMTTVATYFQGHVERYFGRGFSRQLAQPGVVRRAFVGMRGRGGIGV